MTYITNPICDCTSTNGCSKCRPKINRDNSTSTYVPTEFQEWKEQNDLLKIKLSAPRL